ncbi:MAG: hypothetical protein GX057_03765 [Clostridiales bacterium]|nr:hypothetical protein [Clostridiales bacterium]
MENRIICTEIYEAALSMIGERNAVHNADYAERAPYLLAAFCCEAAQIDRLYRKTKGYGKQPEFGSVMIELASPFSLSPRFLGPASLYLAAMLVLDEDEELSDRLYGKYCDAMSAICSEVGATEKIIDVYQY